MKALLTAALVLFAVPAAACSCRPVNASVPPPPYLLLGTVLDTALSPDGQTAATTIRVERRHIGKTGAVITLHSRVHSAACGITFPTGKRQLFAFARQNGRYVTNLCQMLQARL